MWSAFTRAKSCYGLISKWIQLTDAPRVFVNVFSKKEKRKEKKWYLLIDHFKKVLILLS